MNQPLNYKFYHSSETAWDALYEAILGAQKNIFWEVYTLIDDTAGNRFMDALCAKARAGVEVKIIVDGVGSLSLSSLATARLQSAGVNIVWHNKFKFDHRPKILFSRLWHRNHRKLLIIDEKIIFVGGVNVEIAASGWYDLHMKFVGEEMAQSLLNSFAGSYVSCGGRKRDVARYLKIKRKKFSLKDSPINFFSHSPSNNLRNPFLLRRLFWRALRTAKDTFNLATPYYAPDVQFLQLISRAVRRGVKVSIILPWRPDLKFMQWVAHTFYGLTRKAGGEIYFLPRMNHAKSFTVDGSLGMVGSVNLTPRSFFANQEVAAFFTDPNMVEDLKGIFSFWKNEAYPLSDVGWGKRGWYRRVREWWMRKISDYV